MVELSEYAGSKIKTLSGGMKQRLLIAQAILNNPDIIVLDEPTAGLDPKQRIAVRNLISRIAVNKIVLIATHVVSDVEFIAKELILMGEGKVAIFAVVNRSAVFGVLALVSLIPVPIAASRSRH